MKKVLVAGLFLTTILLGALIWQKLSGDRKLPFPFQLQTATDQVNRTSERQGQRVVTLEKKIVELKQQLGQLEALIRDLLPKPPVAVPSANVQSVPASSFTGGMLQVPPGGGLVIIPPIIVHTGGVPSVVTAVGAWRTVKLIPCKPVQIGFGEGHWDLELENNTGRSVEVIIGEKTQKVPSGDPPKRIQGDGDGVKLHVRGGKLVGENVRFRWL